MLPPPPPPPTYTVQHCATTHVNTWTSYTTIIHASTRGLCTVPSLPPPPPPHTHTLTHHTLSPQHHINTLLFFFVLFLAQLDQPSAPLGMYMLHTVWHDEQPSHTRHEHTHTHTHHVTSWHTYWHTADTLVCRHAVFFCVCVRNGIRVDSSFR